MCSLGRSPRNASRETSPPSLPSNLLSGFIFNNKELVFSQKLEERRIRVVHGDAPGRMSTVPAFPSKSIPYVCPKSSQNRREGLLDDLEVVHVASLGDSAEEECAVCLCKLNGSEGQDTPAKDDDSSPEENHVLRLNCNHLFHRHCLNQLIQPSCPTCRKPIRVPQGSCPSGQMTVDVQSHLICPGFVGADGRSVTTIVINYSIPSGKQKDYHDNPGQSYHGTQRVAYLPNNREGRELLSRLIFAWKHGLIFTVGTSLTTNIPNSVVWTSIHHKTTLGGGPYGFPDPGYFLNCHESLDALYVPDASSCMALEETTASLCERGKRATSGSPSGPKSRRRRTRR